MYRKTLLILIVVLSLGILVIGFKIDKELAEMTRLGTASYVTLDEEIEGGPEGRAMEGVPAGGVREFRFTDLDAKTNLIIYRVSGRNAYPHRDGTIEIVRPRIVFYSTKPGNEEVLRVGADRGIYHPRRRKGRDEREDSEAKGTLRGNVVLEVAQGVRAHLPSAEWSEKTRKVTSQGEVMIESPDFRVYGEELEALASADNDEVLIRRNVCVVFDKAEGTTLERIFAGEKREEALSATGVVITCDGVMSYSAGKKNVTFEERVLVTQTGGGFSPAQTEEDRRRWLATVADGEKAVLAMKEERGAVLFAGESLSIDFEEGSGENKPTTIQGFTATGDSWLIRGQEKARARRIEQREGKVVFKDGARLWHAGGIDLEGEEFRLEGAIGPGKLVIRSEKPGVLRTQTAGWMGKPSGGETRPGEGSIRWKERFLWSEEEGKAVFLGAVEASDETGRLEAEGLELAFETAGDRRQLRKMTARGKARYRQEKPYRVARADTIEYSPNEGTLDLTGGERGLASVEEESEVLEAEALSLEEQDGSQKLTGRGVGRLQYYEGVVDPRARETSRPAYDIRWKQRCSVTEKKAVFEGEVEALQARSRLRSDMLELEFEEGRGGRGGRAPRALAARGRVLFDDLSRGEALQAKGDILTFDFATQLMKLESTAEYDEGARNLPEGAIASITFGPNRLSSRAVYYLEDKDTSERLLWTQRGGEADIQRFERRGQKEELVERTRVRCRGSIVYAPPRRLAEAAKRAGMPFGKEPMPEGLVAAAAKDAPEEGLALFVDDVRVRREIAPQAGGDLAVELELLCRYLEVHFGKRKGSEREEMIRMGASGGVQITHKKRHKETVATGERMIWERDDQRDWRAQLLGDPYARVEDEDKQLTGKRVMLYGNPAEVKVEETVSVGGSAP